MTLAAQMAATFQWQSQGRLLLIVVTGGDAHEQRAFGNFPRHGGEGGLPILRDRGPWSHPDAAQPLGANDHRSARGMVPFAVA